LSDFNETFFAAHFRKNTQMPHFVKIRLVTAKLPHAGRRTDRHDEADICFFVILLTRVHKSCDNDTPTHKLTITKSVNLTSKPRK